MTSGSRFVQGSHQQPFHMGGTGPADAAIEAAMASMSMLKKGTHLPQVAGALAFLASDRAAGITGTMVNVTTGLFAG